MSSLYPMSDSDWDAAYDEAHHGPTVEIDSQACAEIVGVERDTWTAYVRARRPKHAPPPLPVRTIGRTPVWDEQAVRAWSQSRPGRGARLDLQEPPVTPTA